MSRAPTCWKHPAQSQVGVCATCLRDRLKELCVEEQYSSPRCSLESNSSVCPPASASRLDENVAALIAADRESDHNPEKLASILQRTHSWSGSRHSQPRNHTQRNGDLGKPRTLARIISGKDLYGQETLPPSGLLVSDTGSSKFELCETPTKGHCKASSWPEIESHKPGGDHRMSSWIASLFGLRRGSKDSKEKRRFFGLVKRKVKGSVANTSTSSVQEAPSSPWSSTAKVCTLEGFHEAQVGGEYQHGNGCVNNKVTPLGDHHSVLKPSLEKVRSVNGRHGLENRSWSTPLRKLMHKENRKGGNSTMHEVNGHEEEKSTWSISSPAELKRFHPSPAYPANCSYTTAYYRDYGASWSLHSSPMPGSKNRWSHQQQHQPRSGSSRPWENRDALHMHSSPFHAAGSNTWNFYLTPLRPVRSTTSRHRA